MKILHFQKPSAVRLLCALSTPLAAALLQWYLWPILAPKTWILLYPAVFCSAAIGRLVGGILATFLSTLLGVFFFIEPVFTWQIGKSSNYLSLVIFTFMGLLFSFTFERYQRAMAEIRRLADFEINSQQTILNQALEAANAGLWEWDTTNNQVIWTENLWRLLGLEPNDREPSHNLWLSTIHSDDRSLIEKNIQLALENNEDVNIQWRMTLAGGKERWLMSLGKPVQDDPRKLKLYRGIVIDISEQKAIENQLKEKERLLADSQAVAHIGSWRLEISTGKIQWSEEAFRLYNLSPRNRPHPDMGTIPYLITSRRP